MRQHADLQFELYFRRTAGEPMTEACEAAVDAASLPIRKRHLPLDRERREIARGNDIFGRRPHIGETALCVPEAEHFHDEDGRLLRPARLRDVFHGIASRLLSRLAALP